MFNYLKNSITALLIVAFMAPGLFLGITPPKEAEAASYGSIVVGAGVSIMACMLQGKIAGFLSSAFPSLFSGGGGLSVPVNETNQTLLSSAETTASTNTDLLYKECVLDPLAWAVKSALIQAITGSIFDWINEGFDGGPTFLTDPDVFFRDVAFSALDGFMLSSGLDTLLCQPFSLNVRMIVAQAAATPSFGNNNSNSSCSIDDIFGSGLLSTPEIGFETMVTDGSVSFEGGGIPAAMGLIGSGNNAFSAVFDVQSEAANRVGRVVGNEAGLLSMGNGYFSIRCDANNDGVNEVCTPGQFLTGQVDDWMGGALGQLEIADEVSEILNAVIATLVEKVLLDAENSFGLLGGA